MVPTIAFIQEKFAFFNAQIFEGKLAMPTIQLSKARTFVGQFSAKKHRTLLHGTHLDDFRLKFSIYFDLPEEEWEDTIIHEMIHYHIRANGMKDTSSHGVIFQTMMNDINERYNRHLTISHKITDQQRDTICNAKKVWHVIALVSFADGRKGLKVLPRIRQRIMAYRSTLLRDPSVSRIDLFMSNDTYFNRFPNSSAFNVILADEQEFMPHIQQSEPLQL